MWKALKLRRDFVSEISEIDLNNEASCYRLANLHCGTKLVSPNPGRIGSFANCVHTILSGRGSVYCAVTTAAATNNMGSVQRIVRVAYFMRV